MQSYEMARVPPVTNLAREVQFKFLNYGRLGGVARSGSHDNGRDLYDQKLKVFNKPWRDFSEHGWSRYWHEVLIFISFHCVCFTRIAEK